MQIVVPVVSNLMACGIWDKCAVASELLRLIVVSRAEIQVE